MPQLNNDTIIKVQIDEETTEGRFQDALYIPYAQYVAMTDEELADMKQERINGWLAVLEAAKNAPPIEE